MEYKVTNRKLLIVEDDRSLLQEMASFFRSGNNDVILAETFTAAKDLINYTSHLDAIILDLQLPDGFGLDFLRQFKQLPPVIILSALGSEEQIVSGLQAGALDYVVKPCLMEHLETRVALRLLPPLQSNLIFGQFVIDAASRVVTYHGISVLLTSSEFNILYFLALHPGEFFTTNIIYERVWGMISLNTATVKRHLCALRQKLKIAAPNEKLIVTEFGKGYSVPLQAGK